MIENYEQPKKIVISDTLELIRYYPYYRRTLPWYQDLTLCKQVDNIDHPYDLDRLKAAARKIGIGEFPVIANPNFRSLR